MTDIKEVTRIILDPNYRFIWGGLHGFYKNIPDDIYLIKKFKILMGRDLDLNNPVTLNEKSQWLKIHDRKDLYTTLVDKFEVKKYIENTIGSQYIIPTLGVWDSFEDINFNVLPNEFVLKCTHDSGGTVVVWDKKRFNKKLARKKIEFSLKRDYYATSREWPYKNVPHRIIAEKMIAHSPDDYKFFMFDGKFDSVMVCSDRDKGYPKFRFYDKHWKRLKYNYPNIEPQGDVDKPENFSQMLRIAEKLSQGFPFVRIDLYNVNGHIYFGEFTLFNQSGFDTDITYDTDLKWGRMTNLNLVKEGIK